jgi:hypothetical protein
MSNEIFDLLQMRVHFLPVRLGNRDGSIHIIEKQLHSGAFCDGPYVIQVYYKGPVALYDHL